MTNPSTELAQRVAQLLARMTLAQKIHLVHGHVPLSYTVPPIPELDIPALKMTDGPAGVNQLPDSSPTTAMPMPIALAATWNPELARVQGDVIAKELYANDMNVLLAPNADIVRQPWWGRAAEEFGEDPFLTSKMVVPFIEGIQAHPVIANIKHFILYNQETNRLTGANSICDERALREIYLPPFAAAARAGVGSAMSSYNNANGIPMSEQRHLLTNILKEELGFEGWVMSDYGSVKSTVATANAGFDQEMPGASSSDVANELVPSFFSDALFAAIESGQVSEETINDKARRVLRTMLRLKIFENPPTRRAFSIDEHAAHARQIATEAITLLKNVDDALPLSSRNIRAIAVIGGDADHWAATGGASRVATPTHITTPLAGLQTRAARDGITVQHTQGTDPVGATSMLPGPAAIPSSVLSPANGSLDERGLRAEYWLNKNFSGQPVLVRTDAQVNLHLGFMSQMFNASAVPPPPGNFADDLSVRWTGTFTAPASSEYAFAVTSMGSARVWFNDELLIDANEPHLTRVDTSPTLQLISGKSYAIQIEYGSTCRANFIEFGDIQFGWTHPTAALSPAMQDAVALAKNSDVAIVFARPYESEQRDRASLTLPNDQDDLIRAVASVNPRTIVVISCGGPVTMPWLDHVQAVVNAYYAGQEQGAAIADILFGDVNPSGKLPLTFPRNEIQVPVNNPALDSRKTDTVYAEGIFVGYRAYDHHALEPQFPFGHGLSYTTFEYKNLHLNTNAITRDEPLSVSIDVTNTGSRAGKEVVQFYIRAESASVPRPPQELKGFEKIALAPGETKTVTQTFHADALAYWDERKRGWVAEAGAFQMLIGSSSRDIRARALFALAETIVMERK